MGWISLILQDRNDTKKMAVGSSPDHANIYAEKTKERMKTKEEGFSKKCDKNRRQKVRKQPVEVKLRPLKIELNCKIK